MFDRTRKIAKAFWESKKAAYVDGYESQSEYTMTSLKTAGNIARNDAAAHGKGQVGQDAAKYAAWEITFAENIKTIQQINRDVKEEKQRKKEEEQRKAEEERRMQELFDSTNEE